MAEPTRWATDMEDGHSHRYVEHFRSLRATEADVTGEARLLDVLRLGAHQ